MLKVILNYLPVLYIAIGTNIILGLYNNINNLKQNFEWKVLLSGVLKAICVSLAFLGLAFCFDRTSSVIDLGVFELNPETIMTASIVLYVGKGLENLAHILNIKNKEQ